LVLSLFSLFEEEEEDSFFFNVIGFLYIERRNRKMGHFENVLIVAPLHGISLLCCEK
jgi:hypothetical protein